MNKKISYRALVKILLSIIVAIGFVTIITSILEHRYDQPSRSTLSTAPSASSARSSSDMAKELAYASPGDIIEAADLWVRVANPTPIGNLNRLYRPGELCCIDGRNYTVYIRRERGIYINGSYLLRYSPRLNPSGSECPDGTLFRIKAMIKLEDGSINP